MYYVFNVNSSNIKVSKGNINFKKMEQKMTF